MSFPYESSGVQLKAVAFLMKTHVGNCFLGTGRAGVWLGLMHYFPLQGVLMWAGGQRRAQVCDNK